MVVGRNLQLRHYEIAQIYSPFIFPTAVKIKLVQFNWN